MKNYTQVKQAAANTTSLITETTTRSHEAVMEKIERQEARSTKHPETMRNRDTCSVEEI